MYNTDLPTRAELPSTRQLIRSTAIAIIMALVLLVTIVLPSEYALDPTGVGRMLGLTQMGEIKQQLAEEAARDFESPVVIVSDEAATTGETVAIQSASAGRDNEETATTEADTSGDAEPAVDEWTDEVSLSLEPGEGAEIKLVMKEGDTVEFEWVAEPGHLNSTLHGDGASGEAITYRNGRAEPLHADELTAAFDGTHGWFWRNRFDGTVTMTLRVRGQYAEIKRLL